MRKIILLATRYSLLAFVLLPLLASAHIPTMPYWAGSSNSGSNNFGLVSCTGLQCESLCDLIHTFVHVVYFGVTIAVFLVAPVLFAWGGIMIMLAGANPGKIAEGKKILTGTIVGIIITIGALLIVRAFITALGVGNYILLTLDCDIPPMP